MYSSPSTRLTASGYAPQQLPAGEQRSLNSELWHACAGPLVSVPPVGSRVVYFPQGHSEQVAASTQKEADIHIPSYPHLPSRLICQLDNVTLHADQDTDEVYTCLTLIPLSQTQQQETEPILPEINTRENKQPTDFFCKTLTASDTSTHGGFSIPRRAAEKVFPPLDYSTPAPAHPAQELKARDLHDNEWHFRHIYRGQPRRHLLTTGWSVFVSAKRLLAGDSVLFIRDDKGQLLLGIRRANRQQPTMPSSVLTSDSMHIGVLAAANHAAASNSRFTVFYNPRASPSEFVIPLSKYNKAVHHTQVSVGMRFRMVFETEESGVRRYMGTITGIGDLDPARWPNSHWRSLKVGWDESTAGERQRRVSLWEIEPLTTPFLICSPLTLRAKRPRALTRGGHAGIGGEDEEVDGLSKKSSIWLRDETDRDSLQRLPYGGTWMNLPRQESSGVTGPQSDFYRAMAAAALQEIRDPPKQLLQRQPQQLLPPPPQIQFGSQPQQQQQSQHEQQQQQISLLKQQQRQQHQPQQLTVPLHFPDVNSVSGLTTSCSRPQSPMELSSLRGPSVSAFTESDLHLSPTMTSSGSFPIQGLLGRTQQGSVPHGSGLGRDPQWFPSLRESPETQALPSCSQEQEQMQSGSHLLFGVSIDQPLGVPNGAGAIAPAPRTFSKGKETQSRFTGANLLPGPYRPPAVPEMPLSPGIMSGLEDNTFLQRSPAGWPPLPSAGPQSCRTFTKVYKLGSVGRSLDVTRFNNYTELRAALAQMFGIEGQLDPARSNFKVVFVDNEGDILLVGDDPWEVFVNCVHCIRILSPSELLQMSAEGLSDRATVFENEEVVPDSVQ